MNYRELLQNYFIIVDIQRNGKTIYVCKNKQTALYDFFEIKNDLYTKVDKVLEDQLRLIYKSEVPKKIYSINEEKDDEKDIDQDIKLINGYIPRCIKAVDFSLKGQDSTTMEQCKKKVDDVKFIYSNKESGAALASYDPFEHTITINKVISNKYVFQHILTHELLHAATENFTQKTCGTMKVLRFRYEGADVITSVAIGFGINEAITDYLAYENTKQYIYTSSLLDIGEANKYLNMKRISGYDPLVNIFYSLAKNVDMNTCMRYYYNCDLDGLINYFNEAYYLKNNDKFLSLIYKMDTYVDILRSAPYENFEQDLYRTRLEMYKDAIDMQLNKLVAENVDLSTVNFDSIISNYRVPASGKNVEYYFEEMLNYFNFQVATRFFKDEHFNFNEDARQMSDLLINAVYTDGYKLDDKYLNNNFFNKLFSHDVFAHNYKLNDNKIIKNMQQKAFCNIFLRQGIINDKQKKYDLLENLIKNRKFLSIDIEKNFDDESICQLVNENSGFLGVLLDGMFKKTVDNFDNMDTNVKLSNQFMAVVKGKSLQMQYFGLPFMELISKYYYSFPIEVRLNENLTGEFCQFVYEKFGHDEKYKKEVADFLKEVDENKKIYNENKDLTF
ncbi:MAG: hypothetical protein ACI4TZ_01050 [Christensenellales bacterium]